MKKCANECLINNKLCQKKSCRYWQHYKEDSKLHFYNCSKGMAPLTLKEVAARENLSLVRVKQIQDKALIKIKKIKTNHERFFVLKIRH